MPVITVLRGAIIPPGYTKMVTRGGSFQANEELAAHLVKQDPASYKITHEKNEDTNGTDIQSPTAEPRNARKQRGGAGIDGQRGGVDTSGE
jgi:hypothetical protein